MQLAFCRRLGFPPLRRHPAFLLRAKLSRYIAIHGNVRSLIAPAAHSRSSPAFKAKYYRVIHSFDFLSYIRVLLPETGLEPVQLIQPGDFKATTALSSVFLYYPTFIHLRELSFLCCHVFSYGIHSNCYSLCYSVLLAIQGADFLIILVGGEIGINYWRMQLHPNESESAAFNTVKSLAAGFIGLDFNEERGDLTNLDQNKLETRTNNIKAFVYEILREVAALIYLHHSPFALVMEIEEYNFIKKPVPALDIWFKHFRSVGKVSFYSDVFKRTRTRDSKLKMPNTFSDESTDSESGKLIAEWITQIAR
jgi:hypothetical protein